MNTQINLYKMADDRYEAYRAMGQRSRISAVLEKVDSMQFLSILEDSLELAKRDEELNLYDIINHVLTDKSLNE